MGFFLGSWKSGKIRSSKKDEFFSEMSKFPASPHSKWKTQYFLQKTVNNFFCSVISTEMFFYTFSTFHLLPGSSSNSFTLVGSSNFNLEFHSKWIQTAFANSISHNEFSIIKQKKSKKGKKENWKKVI